MKNIAEVLKLSCREAHAKTEKTLIGKLKGIDTVGDYVMILAKFYGFFSPLEDLIEKYITPNHLPDIASRKRSALILTDLQKLHNKKPLTIAEDLPVIGNYAQAAGVMYVLEGSTLGGQYIAQMLSKKPALKEHEDAIAFFRGYEQENFLMWEMFLHHLQANIEKEEDLNTAVQSAKDTFSLLEKWILKIDNGRN